MNPCFELWLIQHHREFTKFVQTAEAESMSRKLDGRPGKSLDSAVYMPLRKQAARRAEQLEQRTHPRPSRGAESAAATSRHRPI